MQEGDSQPGEAAADEPLPSIPLGGAAAEDASEVSWIRLTLLIYAPLALISLAWIYWQGGTDALASRLVGRDPLEEIALGTAVGLGVVILARLLVRAFAKAQRLEDAFCRLLGPLPWRTILLLAIASSVGEELFFRGALQPKIGIVLTSIIFGLLHLPMEKDLLPWPLFAILMGFLLGFLYDETGAVIAPATTHFLVNLLNIAIISGRARSLPTPAPEAPPGAEEA